MRCPSCASEVPDGSRFCNSCGSPLSEPAPRVRERRLVSVLFCDLVGFTSFSESRDPEDVRDVLDQYFVAARGIITGYGGTIEKFIGDAVMAVWGAPVAREDDAERSVRAGLDLIAAVARLAHSLALPDLRVRVGVLTGEAAVQVGSADEGMVTGDAVNTAARLQAAADPGELLVDDTTRLACERTIAFEAAGARSAKGKSAPVRAWRAVGILDELEAGAWTAAVEPPLVGRDGPLERIATELGQLLGPDAGVRILSVVGDPGIGKSRLREEVERRAGLAPAIRWHRGRSASFGEGTGLSALVEIVRMGLGIRRDDPAQAQREVIGRRLGDWFSVDAEERGRVVRALQRLLGLEDGTEPIEQGELFSAWRALFERLAEEAPTVLVFEELQLADRALLAFLAHLLEWSPAAPILVLALSRPDPRLAQLAGDAGQLQLDPLSDAEMDQLVAGAVEAAPEVLLAAIRADGGGVPLYAVETLRALADRGVLTIENSRYVVRGPLGEVSVPPTIRALIGARLDGLPPAEQRLLAVGAVLGENFTAVDLARVGELEEAGVQPLLDGLVARALVEFDDDPRSPGRGRYAFTQGVVRRVALSRLSRRERKRYHLAAVERLHEPSGSSPELAALLAGHLLAAEAADPNAADAPEIRDRARAMLCAAAERAASVGAPTEALALFDRAAELTTADSERAVILERAGTVAYRGGEAEAAGERYRAAGAIYAAAAGDHDRLRVHAYELRALSFVRPAPELLPALRELVAELAGRGDAIEALAASVLAFILYQGGENHEALEVAGRAVEVAERCGDHGELLHALGAQAHALAELERAPEAIAVYHRALALAAEHEQRLVAPLAGNLAVSLASIGRYAQAADRAREGIAAAQRGGERFFERWGQLVLGRALCSLGDWDGALVEIETAKDLVPAFWVGMATAPLVAVALARGQRDRVLTLVAEHDRRCGSDVSVFAPDFRVLRAAALLIEADGDPGELARLIVTAEVADYAEWTGWLAPIVDRVVAGEAVEPLVLSLEALRGPGAMKGTPPVRAQRHRLEAHLAARAGERERAEDAWAAAARLAGECGLAFEAAVIALEQAEHAGAGTGPLGAGTGTPGAGALGSACATFARLGAAPWIARGERLADRVSG